MYIYIYIYVYVYLDMYVFIICIWSRPPSLHPPPQWVGSPGSTPTSLRFASYWQHF